MSKQTRSGGPEVKIIFHPRQSGLKGPGGKPAGDWVVTPKDVPAHWRDEITWRTIPDAQLVLSLPTSIFAVSGALGNTTATAPLKNGTGSAYAHYEAWCDGQLATGGSSPGVIVDT